MITRRLMMTGTGAGAAGLLLSAFRTDVVHPELFGARAGMVSRAQAIANTAAIAAAMDSGAIVDGRGRRYDIHGTLRAQTAPDVRRLALRQMQTDAALEKTLLVDGVATGEIRLENVTIDMMGLQQSAGMACSAVQISNCSSATLRNVTVLRGGPITGIQIVAVGRAVVEHAVVRDFVVRLARQPQDDVCQGIEFQRCKNFTLVGSAVSGLVATWPGMSSIEREYSRGIVLGSCENATLSANTIGPGIEQGIDITGGINRDIQVIGNQITDAGTWGIKCANRYTDIRIASNTILSAGYAGVVCSAPTESGGEQPRGVTIRDNLITDTGASGLWARNEPAGILLSGRAEASAGAPSGVAVLSNTIIDRQNPSTMFRGLDARVIARGGVGPDTDWIHGRGIAPNVEADNLISGFRAERSRGWTTANRT